MYMDFYNAKDFLKKHFHIYSLKKMFIVIENLSIKKIVEYNGRNLKKKEKQIREIKE